MRRRLIFSAVLAAALIVPASIRAQKALLDVAEVLRLVLEQSSVVQIADALEIQAEALHRQSLADTRPQIDLQLDPLYGYSTGVLTGQTLPTETRHYASVGLSLSQALPTAGFASLSLANAMGITSGPDTVMQNPSLSFVLSQPVWVNGRLLDLRQLSAAQRASEINWRKASAGSLGARNGNIYAAFSLYTRAIGLRRTIAYLEKSLELADQNLRQVRINLETGRASETDLLELEILTALQRESLWESRYALLQVEQNLAGTLGLERGLGSYDLIDTFPAPALPADTRVLVAEARSSNPSVSRDRLSLEQVQAQTVLSGRNDAPDLSVALTLLPLYQGSTPAALGDSFSSFFTDGTELDWSLAIGLEIPLYNGGKTAYREQANAAGERVARETLAASLRDVQNTYEALVLRQRIILDRVGLLEKNIQLKTRGVADELKKLEVGLGTPLRVESARLELLQVDNELWQARADLFLNSLDLFNLSGRSLEQVLSGSLGSAEK
ncbi:MAG: TolC family protein [Spirochaetales bacterium]|nr:TolC family protein [Spirochaetales bacterium]